MVRIGEYTQAFGIAPGGSVTLAIDEYMPIVIQHLATTIQMQTIT